MYRGKNAAQLKGEASDAITTALNLPDGSKNYWTIRNAVFRLSVDEATTLAECLQQRLAVPDAHS